MRTKDIFMEHHGEEILEQLKQQKPIEMKARVTSVEPKGTFDSNYGTLYKYLYTFEDGVKLVANHKKEGGNFAVGEELEYEIKGSNDYGSWGKVTKPDTEFKPKADIDWARKDRIIARQSSLKIALEFLQKMGFESKDQVSQLQELTYVAEFITGYVLSDSDGTPVPSPQKREKVAQNVNKAVNTPSYDSSPEADLAREQQTAHLGTADDLPF